MESGQAGLRDYIPRRRTRKLGGRRAEAVRGRAMARGVQNDGGGGVGGQGRHHVTAEGERIEERRASPGTHPREMNRRGSSFRGANHAGLSGKSPIRVGRAAGLRGRNDRAPLRSSRGSTQSSYDVLDMEKCKLHYCVSLLQGHTQFYGSESYFVHGLYKRLRG